MNPILKKIDDQTIIKLMNANDRKAVELILAKFGGALYGVALKIVRSEMAAEDILQDSFVKIWKNASSYDANKGKLFTWLLNIVRNTAIDKARTGKFQQYQKLKSIDETVYDNIGHSEELYIQDPGLQNAINQLEDKYKLIIDLLYFKGYTQSEITKELGIPLGTVKSRSQIAIRELRKILKN